MQHGVTNQVSPMCAEDNAQAALSVQKTKGVHNRLLPRLSHEGYVKNIYSASSTEIDIFLGAHCFLFASTIYQKGKYHLRMSCIEIQH